MEPSLCDVYREITHLRDDVAKNDTDLRADIAENNALLREHIVKSEYHEAAIEEHGEQIDSLNDLMHYVKGAAGIFTLVIAWMGAKMSGLKFW